MLKSEKPRGLFLLAVSAVVVATMSGCTRSDGRQAVRGAITLDGRPLTEAAISFQPASSETAANSAGAAADADGRFSIPAAKGLLPGRYRVTIQAWRETDRTFIEPSTGKPVKITAPLRFQETDRLEAAVTTDGSNQFEFHLKSRQ